MVPVGQLLIKLEKLWIRRDVIKMNKELVKGETAMMFQGMILGWR